PPRSGSPRAPSPPAVRAAQLQPRQVRPPRLFGMPPAPTAERLERAVRPGADGGDRGAVALLTRHETDRAAAEQQRVGPRRRERRRWALAQPPVDRRPHMLRLP